MKFAVAVLIIAFLATSQAMSLRQLVGICVEMCVSDADCNVGQHCLSNGCGHTCQISGIHIIGGVAGCGPICDIWCPNGNVVDANGCPTCACNPNGGVLLAS